MTSLKKVLCIKQRTDYEKMTEQVKESKIRAGEIDEYKWNRETNIAQYRVQGQTFQFAVLPEKEQRRNEFLNERLLDNYNFY